MSTPLPSGNGMKKSLLAVAERRGKTNTPTHKELKQKTDSQKSPKGGGVVQAPKKRNLTVNTGNTSNGPGVGLNI
jgi:hypothetical protein